MMKYSRVVSIRPAIQATFKGTDDVLEDFYDHIDLFGIAAVSGSRLGTAHPDADSH